jgi:hypothetical protein
MQIFKEEGKPGFDATEPTISFVKRLNDFCDAMNNRLPSQGLKKGSCSETVRGYTFNEFFIN